MSLQRILVVATNVFREVIRDRVLYLLAFFAVLITGIALLIPYLAAGTENKVIPDLGLAAIGILGLMIAVFVGTGLVSKEIEKRTVYVLIAKPISHAEFIIGKHLGLMAVLAVLVLAMTAIFLVILAIAKIPVSIPSILLAALFQFLELALIVAIAILFGVFTSPLLATLFTIAVYFMGHFSRDLLSLGKLTRDANIQRVTEALYVVLPDLSRLNLRNQATYGLELMPSPAELVGNAAYGLIYTALMLAIAVLIFSRRQF